jgi:hypothetical protein
LARSSIGRVMSTKSLIHDIGAFIIYLTFS